MVLLLDRSVSLFPITTLFLARMLTVGTLHPILRPSLLSSSPSMIMSVSLLQLDNTLMALSKALFFIGIFILSLLLVKIHRISGQNITSGMGVCISPCCCNYCYNENLWVLSYSK